MSELVSVSTKQAVKYLNYNGPVFQKIPEGRAIDPNHENYETLKGMIAAYYNGGR